jgi:predicted ABC-type sugar transport system permease subunit
MNETLPPARAPSRWLPETPAGRAVLALLLVLAVGFVFNADGAFYKSGTHRDALRQASVYGILACGLTLVIISGGIDLAVGSLLALTAVSAATMSIHWGWSGWLVIPAALALGAAAGGRGHRAAAGATVHCHAGDDGLRARRGQIRFRRHESFHCRAQR